VRAGAAVSSLAAGVKVTVLAAWLPSRRAAKIAPVEALSTVDQAPPVRNLRVRNTIDSALTALGGVVCSSSALCRMLMPRCSSWPDWNSA
jgi:putative ABC transport system permease protein